jgi:hypothetical protein
MLSGSALPEDRDAALRLGARAFFTKTGNFGQNKEQTRQILTFVGAPVAPELLAPPNELIPRAAAEPGGADPLLMPSAAIKFRTGTPS